MIDVLVANKDRIFELSNIAVENAWTRMGKEPNGYPAPCFNRKQETLYVLEDSINEFLEESNVTLHPSLDSDFIKDLTEEFFDELAPTYDTQMLSFIANYIEFLNVHTYDTTIEEWRALVAGLPIKPFDKL